MLSRFMTRREQAVLLFFGAAIVIGALVIYFRADRSGASAGSTVPVAVVKVDPPSAAVAEAPPDPAPVSVPTVATSPAGTMIAVSIVGAVERPGVFRLEEDSRVQDLIDAAGGALEDADVSDINLAAKLIDGTTLTVPAFEQTRDGQYRRVAIRPPNPPQYTLSGWTPDSSTTPSAPTTGAASSAPASGGIIDLNRATQAELETLPGIGPVLAAAIVAHRTGTPFQSIDELENVSGIGPKRFAAVRDLITVR